MGHLLVFLFVCLLSVYILFVCFVLFSRANLIGKIYFPSNERQVYGSGFCHLISFYKLGEQDSKQIIDDIPCLFC